MKISEIVSRLIRNYSMEYDVKSPDDLKTVLSPLLEIELSTSLEYRLDSLIENSNLPDKDRKLYLIYNISDDLMGLWDYNQDELESLDNNNYIILNDIRSKEDLIHNRGLIIRTIVNLKQKNSTGLKWGYDDKR